MTKTLMLSQLIEVAQAAMEEHGDIPVFQWSEGDNMFLQSYSAGVRVLFMVNEFAENDEEDDEITAFAVDYT